MISNDDKFRYLSYLYDSITDLNAKTDIRNMIYNSDYKGYSESKFNSFTNRLNKLYGSRYPTILSFLRNEKIDSIL